MNCQSSIIDSKVFFDVVKLIDLQQIYPVPATWRAQEQRLELSVIALVACIASHTV
jgi:hypothetical protein